VHDRAGLGPAPPGRHLQGVDGEFGADVVGDRPAHDGAAEHVEHGAAVDLPGPGWMLGDVGAPQSVRAIGEETALDSVFVWRRIGRLCLRCWVFPPMPARPVNRSSRATRLRPTRMPIPRRSSPWMRGPQYEPREAVWMSTTVSAR